MMPDLSFAHPLAGALALLGIPAVIAIHFLQLPSRPERVSTLFLLNHLEPESRGGRRLQRLRQSVPLWLQLLAVLLIAWLLAEPRWLRPDSAQAVLVVLDSSVSMRAIEQPLRTRLPDRLRALARSAAKTEWLLLETDPAAGRLYSGGRLEELEATLARWRPRLGSHDVFPALRLAQSLARDRGLVIFVTDRPAPGALPPGVELLALGQPLENLGFCGVRASSEGLGGWEALVRNYGTRPQTRRWWLEDAAGQRLGKPETITVQAGRAETLRGRFPDAGSIQLVLEPGDGFEFDDRLPLVRPKPKRLRVQVEGTAHFGEWLETFLDGAPALDRVTEAPDLVIAHYDPLAPKLPEGPSLVFVRNPAPATNLLKGMVVAERDPLTSGLSWDGLLAAESFAFPAKPGDIVLLWQGTRPLITRRGPRLLIGFDPANSNASRLPAFVLLLHRFTEAVRAEVVATETANVETNQSLRIASGGAALRVWSGEKPEGLPGLPRAPFEPGFFEVREEAEGQTKVVRFTGAAHFADAREADFRDAASADGIATAARRQRERHSRQDGLTPLWVLLLGAVMMVNWGWQERRKSS